VVIVMVIIIEIAMRAPPLMPKPALAKLGTGASFGICFFFLPLKRQAQILSVNRLISRSRIGA
jgi:hypothetical protein